MTSPTFDLAVVGAGMVGLAHAYAAARAGKRVVVIERDARANGASIRNFGFITVTGQERGESWTAGPAHPRRLGRGGAAPRASRSSSGPDAHRALGRGGRRGRSLPRDRDGRGLPPDDRAARSATAPQVAAAPTSSARCTARTSCAWNPEPPSRRWRPGWRRPTASSSSTETVVFDAAPPRLAHLARRDRGRRGRRLPRRRFRHPLSRTDRGLRPAPVPAVDAQAGRSRLSAARRRDVRPQPGALRGYAALAGGRAR